MLDFYFQYAFTVQERCLSQSTRSIAARLPIGGLVPSDRCWSGGGTGTGLAGPTPRFELCAGWFTLFPSELRRQSFHRSLFADFERRRPVDEAEEQEMQADLHEEFREAMRASKRAGDTWQESLYRALYEIDKRKGRFRDLSSYSVCVGNTLEKVLRIGDELRFSAGPNFTYSVRRNDDIILSAGNLGQPDDEGPFAIWQSRDTYPDWPKDLAVHPSSSTEALEQSRKIKEFADTHPVYASARIRDKQFRLTARQGAKLHPYYVFLARENWLIRLAGDTSEAVHAAGRLDVLRITEIEDAALHLMMSKTMLL
jgi:hypothetical protein